MKVVINTCYGGFGLSEEAEKAYLARQGKEAFFYVNQRSETGQIDFDSYRRWDPATDEGWVITYTFTRDMGDTFTKAEWPDRDTPDSPYWYMRDVGRSDPDLVAVVEELGEKANGRHAALKVVEIPDGVEWEIEEYDGTEWVAEAHRVWR